jgi:hypothetical protein
MIRFRPTVTLLVVLVATLNVVSGNLKADGSWVTVYQQDFTSKPTEWVATSPSSWTGESYYIKQTSMSNDNCAYVPLESYGFDPTVPWVLEYDINVDWGEYPSGANFGLWDARMLYNSSNPANGSSYALATYGIDDRGTVINIGTYGTGSAKFGQARQDWPYGLDQWYHNRMEYNPQAGTFSLVATEGKEPGGATVASLSVTGLSGSNLLPADVTYLGDTGKGVWNLSWGTSIAFQIDNVVVSQQQSAVPEPASVVCGIIGLGMIGAWIKKHRAA